jgi:hypothetical protein
MTKRLRGVTACVLLAALFTWYQLLGRPRAPPFSRGFPRTGGTNSGTQCDTKSQEEVRLQRRRASVLLVPDLHVPLR